MKPKIIAVLAVLATASLTGCQSEMTIKQESSIPVTVAPVEYREYVVPVHTAGRLSIGDEMRLSFKTGGVIDGFRVEEGDRVTRGQVLASLKLDEFSAQAEMARSAREKAERDLVRVHNLYADSVATLEQLQNSETALEVAKSQERIAEFNLERSVIKAPADGVVLRRLAEANELIGPGTPLLLVGTTHNAWLVKTGVADRDVVRLVVGDSARVVFDTYPNTPLSGQVTEIAESPDPGTGTYEVEISLAPTDMKLLSGFSSKVIIYPSPETACTLVPVDALVQVEGARGTVFKVAEKLRAARIDVEVLHMLDDLVAVTGDLDSSDQIIVRGAAYVSDSSLITVSQASRIDKEF